MKKKNLRFTTMKTGFIVPLVITVVVAISLLACSGSGAGTPEEPHVIDTNDTIPPVVLISTPAAAQIFTNGNNINITGKITDDGGLYRGDIRITNDANSAVIKEQHYEIHGFRSYDYSLSHTASVGAVSDYTITVSFEDHGLNITTKTVKVKVNP